MFIIQIYSWLAAKLETNSCGTSKRTILQVVTKFSTNTTFCETFIGCKILINCSVREETSWTQSSHYFFRMPHSFSSLLHHHVIAMAPYPHFTYSYHHRFLCMYVADTTMWTDSSSSSLRFSSSYSIWSTGHIFRCSNILSLGRILTIGRSHYLNLIWL